jgi:NAD-dependent DNA ligase
MLDPHGQPYGVQFNAARRAERDLSELLGLAKGLLADGQLSQPEATLVHNWVATHPDAAAHWPVSKLAERLERAFADGRVSDEERNDLAELLTALVGGMAGVIVGADASTELPLDNPCPELAWSGAAFVFTGKFAFGTRADCERQVKNLGASCGKDITMDTDYLVIGTFGSRDWVHTSFGRKIEKAVAYRSKGCRLSIVGEDHWAASLPS